MDCKGYTVAIMSLGKVTVSSYSMNHKLNTKSSTESKLVGADDVFPQILWSL